VTKSVVALRLAAAAALLSAAACGTSASGGSDAARPPAARASATGPAATGPAAAGPSGGRSAATAGPGDCPTRRAWATEVTATGHVAWQVSLPTDAQQQGVVVQPLVVGGVGVFAAENAVYGIRLADGRELWRRAFSKAANSLAGAVYGMWPGAPGAVVVLTGQVTDDARLTELYPATGAVGWTLRLPAAGLLGGQAVADGRTLAALLPDGDLESVDLATGRVLWSRPVGRSAGPAAVGPVIASGGGGLASGFLGQGGGRALWTARGLPSQTNLTATAGVFLAWNNVQGGGASAAVTALNPRTGRVEWRFDPGPAVTILGVGQAGIAFATYAPARVYLVNQATGRVRWSAGAVAPAGNGNADPGPFIVTGGQVVTVGSVASSTSSGLIVRSASGGRVQWSAPFGVGARDGVNLALLPLAGGQAIVATTWQGTGRSTALTVDRLATGQRLGSVTLPNLVMAPLTVAGPSVLAQSDSPACAVAVAVSGTGTVTAG
jgi:outer membrane protein assembly factor BamB